MFYPQYYPHFPHYPATIRNTPEKLIDMVRYGWDHSDGDTGMEDTYIYHVFQTPDNEDYPFRRNDFFQYLTMECGEFELMIKPIERLAADIEAWSGSRLYYWQKIYDALCTDYNPLENYNRTDKERNKEKRKEYETSENKVSQNVDNDVAGYDSGEMVDESHSDQEGTEDYTHEDKHKMKYKHYLHAYGNIGVMTSQQMLQSEIDLWSNPENSMYEIIMREFKQHFLLLVY